MKSSTIKKRRRQALMARLDGLYAVFRHDSENPWTCFYCGEPASTLDHQPPISRVSDYRAVFGRQVVLVKVPSCEECNSFLRDTITEDLAERVDLAHERIESKYRQWIDTPYWRTDELDELDGDLKRYVKAAKNQQT